MSITTIIMQHKERFEKSMKEHSTAGFIKSTDHRPLIHRPTDPPATDAVTTFKRLENSNTFTLQNTNTAVKM